jgi:hypothetical protein
MAGLSRVWLLALLLALGLAVSGGAQSTDKPAPKADAPADKADIRLLQVGHIVKIDEKKRTITIENPEDSETQRQSPLGQLGRPGGRARRGTFGRVGNPGRGGLPTDLPDNSQTKILITDTTVVKENGKTIAWNSLKKGDAIHVSGIPKKKDLEAKEIERVPHSIGG